MNDQAVVYLTLQDDQDLLNIGTFLYVVAEKLRAGEEIPNLADLLNSAGATLALLMVNAYERMGEHLDTVNQLRQN